MKGLTLIELMICMALLITFLSVGVPGTHELIEKYQAQSAVSSLKKILIRSRMLALEKETTITICPTKNNTCSENWEGLISAFTDDNNNLFIDADESVHFHTELSGSIGYWLKKRAKSPFIKFSPDGHAFSTATTFLYCPTSTNLTLAKQLIINFQGRVRVDNYLNTSGTPYASSRPLACESS